MNVSDADRSLTQSFRPGLRLTPELVLLALLACWPLQASFADQGSAAGAAPPAAPTAETASAGELQEVVVTATRREENLSKVPLSVTALTQDQMDTLGIKDIADFARFTPGMSVDNSGTNNIAIRGIANTGGAGTTGIYIDDTPIQMRALAFNPDEALPQAFDLDRIEVLRGPQGTLFGAGAEGGTVRYITTQPSLTQSSVYSRDEISYTQGGQANYEAGIAAGGPIIDGTLGARATVWDRRDGGGIDRVNPTAADPQSAIVDSNVNRDETLLVRLAAVWAPSSQWTLTPSIYYQNRQVHDVSSYWPIYSNPGSDSYVSGGPTQRPSPDQFYLPALKVQGDFGAFDLISNTSFYHREELTGYDGTLYNLGFYQAQPGCTNPSAFPVFPLANANATCSNPPFVFPSGASFPLLDGSGIHLPGSVANYRSPATINNGQENFTQEVRLQSKDSNARLVWTTGLFFNTDRQSYLEQIHDPMLNQLSVALTGQPYTSYFVDSNLNPVTYNPMFPQDSYFLQTHSKDQQIAWYGEATYGLTDKLKLTAGARYSRLEFSFNTLTGGPQLFNQPLANNGDQKESAFTPKLSLAYQADPNDMFYATYAKGFRPGGVNNPVPYAACQQDFSNFGIQQSPATYNSDTVDSFEVGAKDNFDNRVRVATSVYYIRWHNIQQTVVPPICQISFIDNLGQAVAKGGDIQAEMLITDALSADLTAGYTEARYIQNATLSSTEEQPIVANGDAIAGEAGGGVFQPAPPFTGSVGLQYKFTLAARQSFVRADYEYQGRAKWVSPSQDPNTLQYDSANFVLSPTGFLSLRSGMTFGRWSVEAFCDNVLDSNTVTNYNWSIDPGTGNSRLLSEWNMRPRTMGLTFIYRK